MIGLVSLTIFIFILVYVITIRINVLITHMNCFCYNTAMDIYQEAGLLKEKINSDPRVLLLNELEKKMNEDEEVMALAYQKDVASSIYSDTLNHYSSESKEAEEALKKLHEAKYKLDSHPLVKEYLKAYQEVRKLYEEVNEILFSNFSANLCPKEK